MKKLLFLALPLILIGCNNKAENYIRISSTESVDVPVSYAEISIGISNHENDLKKLDSTSHLKIVKILSIIRKYGIKDISTENSTMETEYENKNNLTMSQSYLVKMRDLTKIDGFRNELVNVGCNVFKVNNYGSDSLAKYEQQASDKTIENAKLKAEQIAKNSGISIGPISKILDGKDVREEKDEFENTTSADLFGSAGFAEGINGLLKAIEPTVLKKTFKTYATYTVYFTIKK